MVVHSRHESKRSAQTRGAQSLTVDNHIQQTISDDDDDTKQHGKQVYDLFCDNLIDLVHHKIFEFITHAAVYFPGHWQPLQKQRGKVTPPRASV